jgi:hypothetical protein
MNLTSAIRNLKSHYSYPMIRLLIALGLASSLIACAQQAPATGTNSPPAGAPPPAAEKVPESLAMGGAKSVMTFFVTSKGLGKGGDLGGLEGADRHCQALAGAEKAGDHEWRAYLSASASAAGPAVNARDRIGRGPWYNAEGTLIAANVDALHAGGNHINKENAVTERLDPINGVGDNPNLHDILTGSRPDGTAFPGPDDLTCGNWTSAAAGRAQVGHHDRRGQGAAADSWNSSHATGGCGQSALQKTGGAGLFYCFGID